MHLRSAAVPLILAACLGHGPGLCAAVNSLGCLPDSTATLPPPTVRSLAAYQSSSGTLPAAVDYSSTMPPVGNQQQTESCVGWAFGYYLRSSQGKQQYGWVDTTITGQFSPWYIYNQINLGRSTGQDLGSYPSDACNLLVNQGCDIFSEFDPTTVFVQPNASQMGFASPYCSSGWANLSLSNPVYIKQELSLGNPVVLAIQVYPQFDQLSAAIPVYDQVLAGQASRGGHAICLVGYNDSLACSDGTYGAFKFINQWGTSWGANGYGWISYSLLSNTTANPAPVSAAYDIYPTAINSLTLTGTAATYQTPAYFTITRPNTAAAVTLSYSVSGGNYSLPPASGYNTTCHLFPYGGSSSTLLPASGTLTIPAGQRSVSVSLYTAGIPSFVQLPVGGIPPIHPIEMAFTLTTYGGYVVASPSIDVWYYSTGRILR